MNGKKNARTNTHQRPAEAELTAYATGYITAWLGIYASSHGLSQSQITQRVAGMLYADSGGEVLGLEDSMRHLRGEAAEGIERGREVEVVGGARTDGTRVTLSKAEAKKERDRAYARKWYRKNRKRLLAQRRKGGVK